MYENVQSVLRNRWVQAIGALLALVLVGILFYFISPLLVPVFLAILVAYLLNPVVVFLERRGIRRTVSATALAVLGLIFVVSIPFLLVPRIYSEAQALASPEVVQDDEGASTLDRVLDWLPLRHFGRIIGIWTEEEAASLTDEEARVRVAEWVGTSVTENLENLTRRYAGQLTGAVQSGTSTLGGFLRYLWNLIVSFLAFLVNFSVFAFATGYLLVSFPSLVKHSKELIPLRYREKTLSIVRQIDDQLQSFVRGQVIVALIESVIYTIGLVISGVPFAIVIGILTGLFSIIPYLGVILGFIPSVLLVLIRHGVDWHLFGVLATFGAVQAVEETLLRPLIVGDKIGLHPVWVMAAFLVFGNAFGFAGVLLAVPMAAILKVLALEAYDYYRHTDLYRARQG